MPKGIYQHRKGYKTTVKNTWSKPPHFIGEKSANWKDGRSFRVDYKSKWEKENPLKVKLYRKRYSGTESGRKRRAFAQRRRKVQKKNIEGSHTFGEWETLKKQHSYTCPCCERKEPEIKLTEDHIIPITKGGSDYIENIQPLCISCNSKKHTEIRIFGRKKKK